MKVISVIVPLFNEEKNIPLMYSAVRQVFEVLGKYEFEILFINDGSRDNSLTEIKKLKSDPRVRLINFSRNFGKEMGTTAGYKYAKGDAVMCIDADLQHPPEYIPEFIEKWESGADVVIGIRSNNAHDTRFKKFTSKIYYKLIRSISNIPIVKNSTDFRLVDRQVVDEFVKLSEHSRITRGLIDWLGYNRDFVKFHAPDRLHGEAQYNINKLFKLAIESLVANSMIPLRLSGYLGFVIVILSGMLGVLMFLDRFFGIGGFYFSGPATLANIILFLVGILLISIGLLAVYIEHIYKDVQNRPLFVVNKRDSDI